MTPEICPYCGDPIRPGEPTAFSDGERMHLDCAADDLDNVFLDGGCDD